jgi:hypothetical protein
MIPDDILRSLSLTDNKSKVGWIFPDGSVVPCEIMGHRDVLPQKYREWYDSYLAKYQQEMDDDLATLDDDEHPAMHRFDPHGDAENDLFQAMADEGYIRFGMVQMPQQAMLDLNGTPEAVKRHHDVIAYLVAAHAISYVSLTNIKVSHPRRTRQMQFK